MNQPDEWFNSMTLVKRPDSDIPDLVILTDEGVTTLPGTIVALDRDEVTVVWIIVPRVDRSLN